MTSNLRKILRTGLMGIVLAVPFSGCNRNITEPKREDYQNHPAKIERNEGFNVRYYEIVDEDNDGLADVIADRNSSAMFVAYGHLTNTYSTCYARIMTEDMREAATKELAAERELLYQIDRANFDQNKSSSQEAK